MCDEDVCLLQSSENIFIDNESFKSCFARSVAVNSQYKQSKQETNVPQDKEGLSVVQQPNKTIQESPVRYRKHIQSPTMSDSRRFSCGSIVSRRSAAVPAQRRIEIPVENIYNQNKIETLQWQLREVEKGRGMYKAVLKQIVTFLEKAHVSLEHLGTRLNRKNSMPLSKSEQYSETVKMQAQPQKPSAEEQFTSWTPNKKEVLHSDEIPPEKLAQEAFRLLRTAQSLLNTQEPNLTSSEDLCTDEPSDVEFLAQLAKEFPSDAQRSQRATSFNLTPKLILPERDAPFNRKLSLQLTELRKQPDVQRNGGCRTSMAEIECHSLPLNNALSDPLRRTEEVLDSGGGKSATTKGSTSPATASISSTEDESGFSSLNSCQEIGLPLVNSTAIEDVSARSVLLRSMLHNNSGHSSLISATDSELNATFSSDSTLTRSFEKRYSLIKYSDKKETLCLDDNKRNSLRDVKLWQKPDFSFTNVSNNNINNYNNSNNTTVNSQGSHGNHQRWHSVPDQKTDNQSLKVLWV